MKWRAHPAEVIPLWVAEMDVNLAQTVADGVGYPNVGAALVDLSWTCLEENSEGLMRTASIQHPAYSKIVELLQPSLC